MEAADPTFIRQLIGFILTVTLIPLAIIFGLVIWRLHRKKRATTRQWEREGTVLLRGPAGANFSGLESKGRGQVRGNGLIALTGQDLRITRALPSAEWRIPHRKIGQVSLEPSFLGKARGTPILVIEFEQDGHIDRLGVYVRDGTGWVEAIANAADLD